MDGVKPFRVDYAKSSRSECQTTSKKISAGTLRIAKMVESDRFDGLIPQWHFPKAFFDAVKKDPTTERPSSVDDIQGFDYMRPDDQQILEDYIAEYSTVTVSTSTARSEHKKAVMEQSKEIWKIRDLITDNKELTTKVIKMLLEANDIPIKGIGPDDLVRFLAETLFFGVPPVGNKKEGCCASRPMRFSVSCGRYVCKAPLDWGACPYTQSVEDTECKAAILLPKSKMPKNLESWVEAVEEICGSDFPPHQRLYIERKMSDSAVKAGKPAASVTPPSSATKPKTKVTKILKAHLSRACVDPDSGLDSTHHVLDEAYKITGPPPDPAEAFPLQLYDTVLCKTDIAKGSNSQYMLQILVSDNPGNPNAQLWRVWGRVGGMGGGGSKLEAFSSVSAAKAEFCKLFKKQTDNEWSARKNFVKHPGKYFQLDVSYVNEDDDDGTSQNKTKDVIAGDPNSKLDIRVQKVIAAIFDKGIATSQLKSLKVDLTQMPLGKMTEAQLRDAYLVLTEIEEMLNEDTTASSSDTAQSGVADAMREGKLKQLSNQFYSKCPSTDPVLIDSLKMLKEKVEMVDELINLQASSSVMSSEDKATTTEKAAIDTAYEKLETELTPLDPQGDEYQMLNKYVENTKNAAVPGVHGWGCNEWGKRGLRLIDAFRVDRLGEAERFKGSVGNRRLLWHGSRISNYSGILRQGLRIAPPEAPKSGYRFGKGVYFADMLGKSANYCRTDGSAEMLIMACDVSLGKTFETPRDMYMEKPQPGANSTHALSEIIPDPSTSLDLFDYGNADKVVVPYGKPMAANAATSPSCDVSEFIVYDQTQVRIRFLLRLTTNPTTKAAHGVSSSPSSPPTGKVTVTPSAVATPKRSTPSPHAVATPKRSTQSPPVGTSVALPTNGPKKPVSLFIRLDKEDRSLPSASGLPVLNSRTFVEGLRLTVVKGDISASTTDAIVLPSDGNLSLHGMVGERIKSVAGRSFVGAVEAKSFFGKTSSSTSSSTSAAPSTGLPTEFTRVDVTEVGNSIRDVASTADIPYDRLYYLVAKKEKVSKAKEVVSLGPDGTFRRGKDARSLVGIGDKKQETITPEQIPQGVELFVEVASHYRKMPNGSSLLFETFDSAPTVPVPVPTGSSSATTILQTSEVCVIDGHALPASHVIFANSPVKSQFPLQANAEAALKTTVRNVLQECSKQKFSTVALPSVGSGRAGFDKAEAASWIIAAIAEYLQQVANGDISSSSSVQTIKEVCFCLFDDESLEAYKQGILAHEDRDDEDEAEDKAPVSLNYATSDSKPRKRIRLRRK